MLPPQAEEDARDAFVSARRLVVLRVDVGVGVSLLLRKEELEVQPDRSFEVHPSFILVFEDCPASPLPFLQYC